MSASPGKAVRDRETAEQWNALLQRIARRPGVPGPGSVERECLEIVASHFRPDPALPRPLVLRPPWLTEPLRWLLLEEARRVRHRALELTGQRVAHGGEAAQHLCRSRSLHRWLAQAGGPPLEERGTSTYIYYEKAGDHCPVHMDLPDGFEVNLLVPLEHVGGAAAGGASATFAVTPDGPRLLPASPGEAVLFHSARTLHGRTELGEGESVTLLSIGYRMAVPTDEGEVSPS